MQIILAMLLLFFQTPAIENNPALSFKIDSRLSVKKRDLQIKYQIKNLTKQDIIIYAYCSELFCPTGELLYFNQQTGEWLPIDKDADPTPFKELRPYDREPHIIKPGEIIKFRLGVENNIRNKKIKRRLFYSYLNSNDVFELSSNEVQIK